MLNKTTYTTLFFVAFLCASCGKVSKQMIIANKQLFEQLYTKDQKIKQEAGKVDSTAKAKLEEGLLDDEIEKIFTANALIIQKNIALRDSLINVNATDEKALKQTLKDDLNKGTNVFSELRAKMVDDSLTLLMIQEGIKNSSIYKIPNEVVFTAGGYKITENNTERVQNFFEPIVDSIVTAANRYINKKLRIKIVVYGYADSEPINLSSKLYEDVAKSLYHETIDSSILNNSSKLNQELSRLRAEELSTIISDVTFRKLDYVTGVKSVFVDLQREGKGEELPDNKIAYNKIDPRRRIVKFYWKILPDQKIGE